MASQSDADCVHEHVDYAKTRKWIGRHVVMTGTLYHSSTGHHFTRILVAQLGFASRHDESQADPASSAPGSHRRASRAGQSGDSESRSRVGARRVAPEVRIGRNAEGAVTVDSSHSDGAGGRLSCSMRSAHPRRPSQATS